MDRKWWTLIAVCVGTFMLLLDVTIVNVALPSIQTSLKANFSDLQWVVDAYSLMLAALLLTTGSLADLWGRRLIFVLGLVVFTVSSLASGLAESPLWLNLARGAQGIGASAMFSTGLALLGSSFQGRERGVAFGVWGAITGLAVAIGPVIGGGLTTGISWRWIFLVNVPIGAIAMIISLLRVEESKMPHARRPDPIGVVTFSGALAALVYALIKGDQKGWTTNVIMGCLIGAGALLIIFLIAERVQRDRAMFDLSLFRKPTFTGGAIAAFGLSGGLFALFLYLTLYLQDVLGYSALQTGLRFIVLSGGMLLTSFLAGRLTSVVPIRFLISPGLVMVGVGLILMRGINAGTGWTHLIPGFIIAGAGTGLINPPLASTAIGVVRPERAGMASGINSTFRQVGIATGIAGLGAIFSHQVRTTIEALLRGSSQVSAAQAHSLGSSVASGSGARAGIEALPAAARGTAAHALRAAFASGLNEIFLVGAILSLASAVLTLVLIRSKDFEVGAARTVSRPSEDPSPGSRVDVQPDANPGRPAGDAVESAGPPGEAANGRGFEGDGQLGQPDVQAANPATTPDVGESEGHDGPLVQVEGRPADIGSNEHPVEEATQMREHSAAADAAPISAEEGPANGGLHQRMSGYGYQSPLPPPPPPPTLVPPGPGASSEPGDGSFEPASPGEAMSGAAPERTYGYQKPSQAWMAASQAWRTRTEGRTSGVEPAPSPAEDAQSPLEETASDVGQALSSLEPAPWNVQEVASEYGRAASGVEPEVSSELEEFPSEVEPVPSDIEQIRSEIEHTKSRVEELATGVSPAVHSPGDTSPEAAAARLRAVPAARSFWSRFSGSASPESSAPAAEPTDPEPTSPEVDAEPVMPEAAEPVMPEAAEAVMPEITEADMPETTAPAMPDAAEPVIPEVAEPVIPEVAEPVIPEVAEPVMPAADPEPVASQADSIEAETEPEVDAESRSEEGISSFETVASPPESEARDMAFVNAAAEPEPVASAADARYVPQEPVTEEPMAAPTSSTAAEPAWHSDLASSQDVSMSTPPSVPPAGSGSPASASPEMRDVRLVVQAVQSAEEAALAYAREIGEARRHLSEAIAHLDRADEARSLLNRLAVGFGPQSAGSAGPPASAPPASAPPHGFGGPTQGEPSVTTPSPGIAIARPSGHSSRPSGSATDDVSGQPAVAGHGTNGGEPHIDAGGSTGAYGISESTEAGSATYPAVPPPPRPGGWGPGAGGVQ